MLRDHTLGRARLAHKAVSVPSPPPPRPRHTLEVTWQPEKKKKCSIAATSFCSGGPDLAKKVSFWALPLGRKQIGLHQGCPTGFIVTDQDV